MPLPSEIDEQMNFPAMVRKLINPFRRTRATLVCGIPLPLASGKKRNSSQPPTSEPIKGLRNRAAPPVVSRIFPSRSVVATKATTTNPTMALTTKANNSMILSSCSRRSISASRRIPFSGSKRKLISFIVATAKPSQCILGIRCQDLLPIPFS